jgi:hypothetical protein
MSGARPTSRDLAQAVLDAFARHDAAALRSVAVSEREFRDHVWPELPAARPERNLPFSYVWGELRQKSDHVLMRSLREHGRQRFTLLRVEQAGETSRYGTSAIHRDTVLVVRDEAGAERRLRLYGSTLEQDGRFKVFSFVVDE